MFNKQEQQYLIDTVFDGDLNKVGHDPEEYERKHELWDELFLTVDVRGRQVEGYNLFLFLGYIPLIYFSKGQKPFIATLFNQYTGGLIDSNQMFDTAMETTKQLRNEDIREHCHYSYEREVYRQYFYHLPDLKEAAKQRIARFFGFDPLFEASVKAEILLREAMNDKKILFEPDNNNFIDTRLLTITMYRDIFLREGFNKAEDSPLIGAKITDRILKRRQVKQA